MSQYVTGREEEQPRILRMHQQDNPLQCPFCLAEGEGRIDYDTPDMHPSGELSLNGVCQDCGERWTVYFELTDFT